MARSVKTDLPIHITSDYDQLVQTLGKYFSSEGKEATFQAEFRLRKRKTNEKLNNFAHDLTRLCKKAFPKMDRASREQFVLERFKLELDSALRQHIQFQHPESLETAIYAGLEFEAMKMIGKVIDIGSLSLVFELQPLNPLRIMNLLVQTQMIY